MACRDNRDVDWTRAIQKAEILCQNRIIRCTCFNNRYTCIAQYIHGYEFFMLSRYNLLYTSILWYMLVYTYMKKSKHYKSILQYIIPYGLTKKIEQGLLSHDGDGVEYGASISSFPPLLALPHEWRHSRTWHGGWSQYQG